MFKIFNIFKKFLLTTIRSFTLGRLGRKSFLERMMRKEKNVNEKERIVKKKTRSLCQC